MKNDRVVLIRRDRKLAILATFFKISTSNLFCQSFTLRLIGKPNKKSQSDSKIWPKWAEFFGGLNQKTLISQEFSPLTAGKRIMKNINCSRYYVFFRLTSNFVCLLILLYI